MSRLASQKLPIGNNYVKKFGTWLLCCLLVLSPSAQAAMQIFMLSDQIKGESKDAIFPDSVELQSVLWAASRDPGFTPGSGDIQVSDITMKKKTDASSPDFFRQLVTGEPIPVITLVFRKTIEPPIEYMAFRLTDVGITRFTSIGSADDDIATEEVTITYGKIEFFYQEQKEDGKGGDVKGTCYDVKANVDC